MSVAYTRLSHWLWGRKDHKKTTNTSFPDFPSGYREPDSVKFSSANGPRARSSSRRIKKKWQRQEEQIDREFDVVIVHSDGGCMSGWESDDSDGSDWSIGWSEPHAREFQCEAESDSSFAVLVPCYRRGLGKPEKSVKVRSMGASNLSGCRKITSKVKGAAGIILGSLVGYVSFRARFKQKLQQAGFSS